MRLAGSWLPDQGSNLGPRRWKHSVLTTEMPGNSHCIFFFTGNLTDYLVNPSRKPDYRLDPLAMCSWSTLYYTPTWMLIELPFLGYCLPSWLYLKLQGQGLCLPCLPSLVLNIKWMLSKYLLYCWVKGERDPKMWKCALTSPGLYTKLELESRPQPSQENSIPLFHVIGPIHVHCRYQYMRSLGLPWVQWLRICLPMQGTRVQSLVQEDPACCGVTKPMCHKYLACTLEPACHNYWSLRALGPVCCNYWASVPQPLSLRAATTEAHTPRAHAPQWEATAMRSLCTAMKSSPHLPQLEKALPQKRRPNTAKKNK